jgi:hypothetical protein
MPRGAPPGHRGGGELWRQRYGVVVLASSAAPTAFRRYTAAAPYPRQAAGAGRTSTARPRRWRAPLAAPPSYRRDGDALLFRSVRAGEGDVARRYGWCPPAFERGDCTENRGQLGNASPELSHYCLERT